MNQSLSTLWGYVNRHAYPVLFVLFALWMCIGIFPLVCYETDSMENILGCELLYEQGWHLPPIYSYQYRMQPFTMLMVVALKHLMPFFTCEQIYCVTTAIASFIFLIGCIEFARHVTKVSRAMILIAAMLLPEMYAIAMYPNSAIPAAACFIWGLYNIAKGRHWLAVLLLCIAPVFRVDLVIVYPVVLPLFLYEGKSWKQSLLLSAIYGALVVVVGFFLFWLVKSDVLVTVDGFVEWEDIITRTQHFMAIFGFYSLAYVILLPLGLFRIFKQRYWKELFLVLFPIFLNHFIFREFGNASKHYLYIAPFVIIAGVRALAWICEILQKKTYLKWISIAGVVVFLTFSLRVMPDNVGYNKDFGFIGDPVIPFYSAHLSSIEISVGIGAGQHFRTADECMLSSGNLFYPWYIRSIKNEMEEMNMGLFEVLKDISPLEVLTIGWGTWGPPLCKSIENHNRVSYHEADGYFTLENGRDILNIREYNSRGPIEDPTSFADYLKGFCQEIQKDAIYVMVVFPRYRFYLDGFAKQGKVEKVTEALYKVDIDKLQ